jgi:hypothetical protein
MQVCVCLDHPNLMESLTPQDLHDLDVKRAVKAAGQRRLVLATAPRFRSGSAAGFDSGFHVIEGWEEASVHHYLAWNTGRSSLFLSHLGFWLISLEETQKFSDLYQATTAYWGSFMVHFQAGDKVIRLNRPYRPIHGVTTRIHLYPIRMSILFRWYPFDIYPVVVEHCEINCPSIYDDLLMKKWCFIATK